MKRTFTLLFALVFSAALMAAGTDDGFRSAKLTVRSFDKENILVVIDGKRFDPRFNSLMISNLRPGTHKVRVLQERRGFLGSRYREIFDQVISARPGSEFLITVDRFGQAQLDQRMYNNDRNGRNDNGRGFKNGKGNKMQDDDWNDNHGYNYDQDGSWDNDYNNDRSFDNRNDNSHNSGSYDKRDDNYSREMSSIEFSNYMQEIRNEWRENDKLTIAKRIVDYNYLNSTQVKEMVMLLGFENNKLDLAKYAFKKTTDPEYFYVVKNALKNKSSRDALDRYTRAY